MELVMGAGKQSVDDDLQIQKGGSKNQFGRPRLMYEITLRLKGN
jgi:hypothetical protein